MSRIRTVPAPPLVHDTADGITPDDVRRGLAHLDGRVVSTPVVRSDDLDRLAGARLWLKAENLQRGGSFKIRGALLAVDRLAWRGSAGVCAQSTGNHAISVALAAREHGLPAVLVLPENVSPVKVRRVREAGGEVVLAGITLTERMAVVDRLRAERGLDVVDPYQNRDVVTGQGTATAELLQQVRSEGGCLDAVVIPVGGGSAVAGACVAAIPHDTAVVAAEPLAVPALSAARAQGEPVEVPAGDTIADGLRPNRIGLLPFSLTRTRLDEVVLVDETAIADATVLAAVLGRLLVEPAAGAALAAALQIARRRAGTVTDIGVLISGGNVDPRLLAGLLADRG